MSWFSELTSKAEAMLVKLDQGAAQALQQPDGIIRGLDQAISSISSRQGDETDVTVFNDEKKPTEEKYLLEDSCIMTQDSQLLQQDQDSSPPQDPNQVESMSSKSLPQVPLILNDQTGISSADQELENEKNSIDQVANTVQNNLPRQSNPYKRFTMQTSKSKTRSPYLVDKTKSVNRLEASIAPAPKNHPDKSDLSTHIAVDSPEANVIRASINRSLEEYVTSTLSKSPQTLKDSTMQPSSIGVSGLQFKHSPLVEVNDSTSKQLHPSSSFSIDLPDSNSHGEFKSDDIANRIWKSSVQKKGSTFYLHKVINRLAASTTGQTDGLIFSNNIGLKYRRAQMRAAMYARRLNYYNRSYPKLKYLILVYFVLSICLIIYVLFFY